MFSFQDFESLRRLAHIMLWPLSAGAVYMQFGILEVLWELPEKSSFFYLPSYWCAFVVQVVAVAVLVEAVDFGLSFAGEFGWKWVVPVFGICLLTVGVIPLHNAGSSIKEVTFSPLWSLACLAWGYRIFLPEQEKKPNKSSQQDAQKARDSA